MLYVGYPLSYENACKMFNVDKDEYGKILDCVVKQSGLRFDHIDKNLSILGIEVKEVANLWDKFASVDESIMIIMKYKLKFVELIERSGIDISEVEIERMEEEPILVKNPPPYLITV